MMKKTIIPYLVLFTISLSAQVSLDPYYHTYDEIKAEIDSLQIQFPNLVFVDSIGVTNGAPYQEPLPIWAVKLSDNAAVDEDEPAVLFVGQCHAEEVLGVEITMYMINEILENRFYEPYCIWLSELEIWFVPSINPEGLEVVMDGWDTAFRKNKRDCNENGTFIEGIDYEPGPGYDRDGVDINRNYSFNWVHGDSLWAPGGEELWDYYRGPDPFSEGGTRAVRDLAEEQHFIYSINWHSSRSGNYSEKVYYSFMWDGEKYAEDIAVNQIIGETVAGLIENETGTGYYEPSASQGRKGNAHDWFYQAHSTTQLLIECGTSNLQPPAPIVEDTCERCSIGAYWLMNRVLGYETDAAMLTGHITDANTGEPLKAEIIVEELSASYFAPRKSDELFGRFWRVLLPGTYNLKVIKKGYEEQIINNVTINNSSWTNRNIQIIPLEEVNVTGNVYCNSVPIPAEIVIFDVENDTIQTTNGAFDFATFEGEHQVLITSDGCVPFVETVNFTSGTYDLIANLLPEVVLFHDNWETGFAQWEVFGDWSLSSDAFNGAYSLSNHSGLFYSHDLDDYISLINPVNLNGAADDVVLYFWQKYYTEHDNDICSIEASIDGIVWDELAAFSGINDYWHRVVVSLADYIDNQVYLRFRFVSDETLNDPGWKIDGIKVISSEGIASSEIPTVTKLFGNYPNPFNPSTTITFSTTESTERSLAFNGNTEIIVFNLKGQKVKTLIDESLPAGYHSVIWNGTDDKNKAVASGIYFYKLKTKDYSKVRKMLLLK